MLARQLFLILILLAVAVAPASAQYPGQYGPPPVYMPPGNYTSQFGMPPPPMRMGQRCASAAGVCFMGVQGPVGAPCFCQTPYGSAPGQVLP